MWWRIILQNFKTGMECFGLKMDFLWIYQVLVIIFTLKIIFHLIFLGFSNSWTGRTNSRESRAPRVKILKTQSPTAQDGGLVSRNYKDPYANVSGWRGMIKRDPLDQRPMTWIQPATIWNGTPSGPSDPRSMDGVVLTRDLTAPVR
jgi:hypothetical protein